MSIIEKLVGLVDAFDLASMFPALDSVLGWAVALARIFVLAAPVTMLVLGLRYRYLPAKEANYEKGYRFRFAMQNPETWSFTQQTAGVIWTVLGAAMLVIVLILSLFFGIMKPMAMANTALCCVVIEVVLIVASCFFINNKVKQKYSK